MLRDRRATKPWARPLPLRRRNYRPWRLLPPKHQFADSRTPMVGNFTPAHRLAAGQSVMRIRSGFGAKAEEARANNASIARTYDEIVDFIDSQAWGL